MDEKSSAVDVITPVSKSDDKSTERDHQSKENEATNNKNIKRSLQALLYGLPNNLTKKHLHKLLTHTYKINRVEVEILTDTNMREMNLSVQYPIGRAMLIKASARKDINTIVEKFDGMTSSILERCINDMEKAIVVSEKLSKKAKNKRKYSQIDISDMELPVYKAESVNQFIKCRGLVDVDVEHIEKRNQFNRVIVRNISFQAQMEHIWPKLLKYGPIVDITLPVAADVPKTSNNFHKNRKNHSKGESEDKEKTDKIKHRGFAFVTFLCQKDAEMVVKSQQGETDGSESEGKSKTGVVLNVLKVCNREVAVDFCDNKTEFERKKQLQSLQPEETKDETKTEAETEANDDDSKSEVESINAEEGEKNDDEDISDLDVQDSGESDLESEENLDSDEEASNPDEHGRNTEPLNDASEGRTIFLRDLSVDITTLDIKRDLYRLLREANVFDAKMISVYIVKDKITGLGKGTAFVKFERQEDALLCSDRFSTCTINDRECRITMAIDRESAEKLREEQKNQVKDRRHLYLMNEGVITTTVLAEEEDDGDEHQSKKRKKVNIKAANNDKNATHVVTPGVTGFRPDLKEALSMSSEDKEKRALALNIKKKTLLNPLFFISDCRLSIRNLHKDITDRMLKSACVAATKSGLSKGLVNQKDLELLLTADMIPIHNDPNSTRNNVGIPQWSNDKNVIVSCKIMVDKDKINKSTGLPQGKGYSFVEFSHHGYAMACLRELNNNSSYSYLATGSNAVDEVVAKKGAGVKETESTKSGGAMEENDGSMKRTKSKHRLLVEFAVENIRKVQILEKRKEHNKQQQAEANKAKEEEKQARQHEEAAKAKREARKEQQAKRATKATGFKSKTAEEEMQVDGHGGELSMPVEESKPFHEGSNANEIKKSGMATVSNKQLKRKERKLKRKAENKERKLKKQEQKMQVAIASSGMEKSKQNKPLKTNDIVNNTVKDAPKNKKGEVKPAQNKKRTLESAETESNNNVAKNLKKKKK